MFILIGWSMLNAQQREDFRPKMDPELLHIIKVNVFSPLVGTINLHYEKRLNDNGALQAEGFYFGGQLFNQQINVRGIGLTVNYRFYFTQKFPSGWFLQPFIRYQRYWPLVTSNPRNNDNVQVGGLGMVFGYQVIAARRISLDIYGGPMYSKLFANDKPVNRVFIPVFNGPWLRFGATIGFLF